MVVRSALFVRSFFPHGLSKSGRRSKLAARVRAGHERAELFVPGGVRQDGFHFGLPAGRQGRMFSWPGQFGKISTNSVKA
jgi:hypothetical protein